MDDVTSLPANTQIMGPNSKKKSGKLLESLPSRGIYSVLILFAATLKIGSKSVPNYSEAAGGLHTTALRSPSDDPGLVSLDGRCVPVNTRLGSLVNPPFG